MENRNGGDFYSVPRAIGWAGALGRLHAGAAWAFEERSSKLEVNPCVFTIFSTFW